MGLINGTYYGKQESTSNQEIEIEMGLLEEEILEMKKDGEVLLAMDANAKIGLLGENVSRNGHKLLDLISKNLNKSQKCKGTITRNKAGYTATEVAWGWAGAIFKATPSFGQEQ